VTHSEIRRVAALVSVFGALGVARVAEAEPVGVDATQAEPTQAEPSRKVGMFVDVEWRLMGLADHVSHGPAFAVGATFFDGFLRVGIGGLSRPGPFNPATFDVTIPNGGTYKGKSVVSLRSDGAMAGVHLGISQRLPLEGLALQVPVTIGYGGFGYYLSGEDRDTPDGRRVSEWEDELFGDRDSFLGVVIDAALRVRYQPKSLPWLAPYAGAAFTIVPGFETIVSSSYLGVSGIVGVEMGLGI